MDNSQLFIYNKVPLPYVCLIGQTSVSRYVKTQLSATAAAAYKNAVFHYSCIIWSKRSFPLQLHHLIKTQLSATAASSDQNAAFRNNWNSLLTRDSAYLVLTLLYITINWQAFNLLHHNEPIISSSQLTHFRVEVVELTV